MTTENGFTRPPVMRARIERLRRRAEYLEDSIAAKFEQGYSETSPAVMFAEKELAALEWAIPVLEAEYDAAVRLQRKIVTLTHPKIKNVERAVESGEALRV